MDWLAAKDGSCFIGIKKIPPVLIHKLFKPDDTGSDVMLIAHTINIHVSGVFSKFVLPGFIFGLLNLLSMADNIVILGSGNVSPEEIEKFRLLNRELLIKQKDKSDNDFEKMHTLIATGALTLSIGFAEKLAPIVTAQYKWILIGGWIFLVAALITNFLSHLIASRFTERQIDSVDAEHDTTTINNTIEANNRVIRRINWGSAGAVILGIAAIVVYCSINVLAMPSANTDNEKEKKISPKQGDEYKGRTIVPIVQPKPQPAQPVQQPPAATPKKTS